MSDCGCDDAGEGSACDDDGAGVGDSRDVRTDNEYCCDVQASDDHSVVDHSLPTYEEAIGAVQQVESTGIGNGYPARSLQGSNNYHHNPASNYRASAPSYGWNPYRKPRSVNYCPASNYRTRTHPSAYNTHRVSRNVYDDYQPRTAIPEEYEVTRQIGDNFDCSVVFTIIAIVIVIIIIVGCLKKYSKRQ